MLKKEIARFRSNPQDVIEAIDNIQASFLRDNKRATSVDLFYSEFWKPGKPWPEYRAIVAYYKPGQETELEWIQGYTDSQM